MSKHLELQVASLTRWLTNWVIKTRQDKLYSYLTTSWELLIDDDAYPPNPNLTCTTPLPYYSELTTLREEMAAQDWYRKELENTLLAAETDKQTMLTIVQSIKSLSQQQPQSQSQSQVITIIFVQSTYRLFTH